MYNTIQITKDEDRLILKLKKTLGFKSKKAVVMEGLRKLLQEQERDVRHERLRKASLAVRDESMQVNAEFAAAYKVLGNDA